MRQYKDCWFNFITNYIIWLKIVWKQIHDAAWSIISEELEQVDKDGDNVSVKNYGTNYVVIDLDFIALASHDKLGVKEEVEAEEDHSDDAPDNVHGAAPPEEEEQGCEGKSEANHKEERPKDGEVTLGCVGVTSDADCHTSSCKGCNHDNLWVEAGSNEGHYVGLTKGKDAQDDVVEGDWACNWFAAYDCNASNDFSNESSNNETNILSHPEICISVGQWNGHYSCSEEKLHSHYGVDFPDKVHPILTFAELFEWIVLMQQGFIFTGLMVCIEACIWSLRVSTVLGRSLRVGTILIRLLVLLILLLLIWIGVSSGIGWLLVVGLTHLFL